jgi:transposase-like protein
MKKSTKQEIINEFLLGQISYRQLAKKHKIGRSTVHRWLQTYNGITPVKMVARDIVILPEMIQEIRNDLPSDVIELRRQLEQEKLRTKLLTAMIEIAETELNIPIRKKSGTKP